MKTDRSASASLKKQEGTFSEISAHYGFDYDQRDRVFMPTSGSITGFSQTLPVLADRKFIANTFTSSHYKSLNENVVGAAKIYLSA